MLRTFGQLWRESRTLRWGTTIVLGLLLAVSLGLMYLLAQSTNTPEHYEHSYQRLLAVNLAVVAALFLVLLGMGWSIWQRYRRNKFGSRLLVKWVAVFVIVASLPGALIYLVSYQFVNRSIASWFDVRVETALDAGLNLGRNVLDELSAEAAVKARVAAMQLGRAPAYGSTSISLEQLRSQVNAEALLLWSAQGELLGSAASDPATLSALTTPQSAHWASPTAEVLAQLQQQPTFATLQGVADSPDNDLPHDDAPAHAAPTENVTGEDATSAPPARILAWSAVRGTAYTAPSWILLVVQPLPPPLVQDALRVQAANRAYQERALNRNAMRSLFIGTLSLTLILSIFAAVLLAALLASQLARPLLLLAEGVRQVAEGDLGPKPIYQGHDELGKLTHAFANMTRQLADTRQALTTSLGELDASRSELQTILDNLSSAVLVLQDDGHIVSANRSAARVLGVAPDALHGHSLADTPALAALARIVQQHFDTLHEPHSLATATPAASPAAPLLPSGDDCLHLPASGQSWQHIVELNARTTTTERLQHDVTTLVARGVLLPEATSSGTRLLVCEDISAVVSVQRAQAWGEVARRLAHEIKNPLTPIQLSAERLERKLMADLPTPQQAVLTKAVKTIVDQVDAMKRLVNEFRDYARLPAAKLHPVDLNALISEILQLYENSADAVPIHTELDPQCHPILADAQQLRQVLHNLVQNAQDSHEQAGCPHTPVTIQTQWRPATQRVRLSIIDSGTGFPASILQRAFEPYVTTKAKGTGLGLAVVKKIADEHHARLSVRNRLDEHQRILGAHITLLLPTRAEDTTQEEKPAVV